MQIYRVLVHRRLHNLSRHHTNTHESSSVAKDVDVTHRMREMTAGRWRQRPLPVRKTHTWHVNGHLRSGPIRIAGRKSQSMGPLSPDIAIIAIILTQLPHYRLTAGTAQPHHSRRTHLGPFLLLLPPTLTSAHHTVCTTASTLQRWRECLVWICVAILIFITSTNRDRGPSDISPV